METANFLASVWGLGLIIAPLAILINPKLIKEMISAVEKETTAFYSGVVAFVIGVMTVLSNNVWATSWMTIVTVLGWLTIIKGCTWMFIPQKCAAMASKIKDKDWIIYAIFVVFLVGLVTTYFGFVGK